MLTTGRPRTILRASRAAQPQNDLPGLGGLVAGERVDQRQCSAGVGQVHEPLGDSDACRVVTDHRESNAREHIGGADRRHMGLRVGLRALAFPHVAQVQDGARRLRAGDAVRGKARVDLELADRALGEGPEDAVDRPAGEAEDADGVLESSYVGAVEVRHTQIEHAVAQREACVDECRPGLLGHEPVLGEPVLALEGSHGLRGGPQEHAIDARRPKVIAEGEQAALDVFDGGPAI